MTKRHETKAIEVTTGVQLWNDITAYLDRRIVPAHAGMNRVLALWIMMTFIARIIFTFPYMAVTAAISRSGKSRVLELTSYACFQWLDMTGSTPASMLSAMSDADNECTLIEDEAESSVGTDAKSLRSQIYNRGYRQNGKISRVVKIDGVMTTLWYGVFCPKMVAMIGDPTETMRSRCIQFEMRPASAPTKFSVSEAMAEGQSLRERCLALFGLYESKKRIVVGESERFVSEWKTHDPIVDPAAFETYETDEIRDERDREIWGSMLGFARLIGASEDDVKALIDLAQINDAFKDLDKRRSHDKTAERAANEQRDRAAVVTDLAKMLGESEHKIFTVVAVERLKAQNGYWRMWKGSGLTQDALGELLSTFGIGGHQVNAGKKNIYGMTLHPSLKANNGQAYDCGEIRKIAELVKAGEANARIRHEDAVGRLRTKHTHGVKASE